MLSASKIKTAITRLPLSVSLLIILFCILIFYSFAYPKDTISQILQHFNGLAAFATALITLSYVIITTRQLNTMKKQLEVMNRSVTMQIQPLVIPQIKKVYLERINAYLSMESNFKNVEIMYRFMCEMAFENVGNGAAINVTVFPVLEYSPGKYLSCRQRSIHCVADKDSVIHGLMIFDEERHLLENIGKRRGVCLHLEIYFKNIFGVGFHERVAYGIRIDDEKVFNEVFDWQKFFIVDVPLYEKDIIRHSSLKETVPEDAELLFNKIQDSVSKRITNDILLNYWTYSNSYEVSIVEFNEALSKMEELHKKRFPSIYKNTTCKVLDEDNKQ